IGAVQGRAGTGKTRTLGAIREAHERRGHRVVGLGPTNVVARSLAADGFETAMTAHLALIHLNNGRDRWGPRTVVIVDEAAMLDTDILDRVMRAVDRAGARLLLVGDDRQLQSVQRGGLFAPVAALAGPMELRRVQRQRTAWQREASEAFAAGDMTRAIGAYADHGCLAWEETLDESRAALVAAWAEASARDPEAVRFIYASTNAEVRRLNAGARAIRVERGEIGAGLAFRTARGEVHAAAGDRIQFHDTDRHAGIFNGVLGMIVSCSEEEIAVRTDGGALVSFDPERFEGWALGYAGTVYRGQGKTQTEVFALYDHAFAWSPSTSYVALTRQTERVVLHVPEELAADRTALIRQMGRARNIETSLGFTVRDELAPALRENLDRLADAEAALAAAHTRAEEAARALAALPAVDLRRPETLRDRTAAAEQAHEARREVLSCTGEALGAAFAIGRPAPVDRAAVEAAKTAEAETRIRAEYCRALEDARGHAVEARDAVKSARALPKEDAASVTRHAEACRDAVAAFDVLADLARDAGEEALHRQAQDAAVFLKLEPLLRAFEAVRDRIAALREAEQELPAPRTVGDVQAWRASGEDRALARDAAASAADAVADMRERLGLDADTTAQWRTRAEHDRGQASALRERRDPRLDELETPVERAAVSPADRAAWTGAADAADRILPDLDKGLRERAEEAGRGWDLVLELARAFTAPVAAARAAADAAIAEARAAGDPQDALKDAQLRSQAWERACKRIGAARDTYRENGSPGQAAAMAKELDDAQDRKDFQDARARAHRAVRAMKEKLDELETVRAQVHRELFGLEGTDDERVALVQSSSKVLWAAREACREAIGAQEVLAGLSPDGNPAELEELRNRAEQARETETEITRSYSRVAAVKQTVMLFEREKRRPHPDWERVANLLEKASGTGGEDLDAFALAAQMLVSDRQRKAESLDLQRKAEARQSAARQQEQTVAGRNRTKEKGLSSDREESEGWSISP
ncbi:MAG: AAA family ATPase, partial [Alphaproteobacteria bacterium]|nr:AAA family ATPase [Alphaproteobacteria bacterium]